MRAADAAIGSHANAVARAHDDFGILAEEIAKRIGLSMDLFFQS